MEIKMTKVEMLNPDGTTTDITDQPDLWYPRPITKKEIEMIRLWKIINDNYNFFEIGKQQSLAT